MNVLSGDRRTTAVVAFGAAAVVCAVLFLFARASGWMSAGLYVGFGAAELCATVYGIRRYRPRHPWPWRLLAVGVASYSIANCLQFGWPLLRDRELPFPSPADVFFLAAYLLFAAALVSLTRARSGKSESLGSAIDATIVTVCAGVVAWNFLVSDVDPTALASTIARIVSFGYPALDVALLALLARMTMTRQPRPPAFWLLFGFVVAQLAADTSYTVAVLHQSFYIGHPLTVGWILSFGCLGMAALHPSMATLAERRDERPRGDISWGRLTFLGSVVSALPVGYLLKHDGDDIYEVLVSTIVLFVLCIVRMALIVRESHRMTVALTARETELRSTVEALHESEASLAHLAQHDALTGLPNRALFDQSLTHALGADAAPVAVMILDLDGFKKVNDSLGHTAGDDLLVAVARRLSRALRPGDIVARLGGDEFSVLARGADDRSAARIAGRLLAALDDPIALEGRPVVARASVGVAVRTVDGDGRDLLRNADAAMYEAKRKGGQRYEVFSKDMHARVLDRLALECELREAELGVDVTVHYQPLVDLRTGELSGFEALLRWLHPERGWVSTADFIPIAEETGLIIPIGKWVLEEACRNARSWGRGRPEGHPIGINVNVSARQLADPGFVVDVATVLRNTGLAPELLTLEVTETMMIADENEVYECLVRIKALGARVSVDDFGTGYSSLGHLRKFPVDELKIDRSFIASINDGSEGFGVAAATIHLARSLHIDVVAEGIECEDQLKELRRHRCDRGQGYFLGRPMDVHSVRALLDRAGAHLLPPVAQPRVLVVDDDDAVRTSICRILERAGFDVTPAPNGIDALAAASQALFDAVLLDVDLPDMSGTEVCHRLKQATENSALAVIHLSGSATGTGHRVRGLDAGADGYLIKPIARADLVATLRAAIRARSLQLA